MENMCGRIESANSAVSGNDVAHALDIALAHRELYSVFNDCGPFALREVEIGEHSDRRVFECVSNISFLSKDSGRHMYGEVS